MIFTNQEFLQMSWPSVAYYVHRWALIQYNLNSISSAVTVSIFVFVVGLKKTKSCKSRSVSVFMVVYKQYHMRQVARCG